MHYNAQLHKHEASLLSGVSPAGAPAALLHEAHAGHSHRRLLSAGDASDSVAAALRGAVTALESGFNSVAGASSSVARSLADNAKPVGAPPAATVGGRAAAAAPAEAAAAHPDDHDHAEKGGAGGHEHDHDHKDGKKGGPASSSSSSASSAAAEPSHSSHGHGDNHWHIGAALALGFAFQLVVDRLAGPCGASPHLLVRRSPCVAAPYRVLPSPCRRPRPRARLRRAATSIGELGRRAPLLLILLCGGGKRRRRRRAQRPCAGPRAGRRQEPLSDGRPRRARG